MTQNTFTIRPSMRPIIVWYVVAGLFFIPVFFTSQAFIFSFIFLLIPIIKHVKRNFTIYTLTADKVAIRTGVIGKAEMTIPLSKIQGVASSYSIEQRIFGIGNVLIESAGGRVGGVPMKDIEDPEKYAKQILEASGKS